MLVAQVLSHVEAAKLLKALLGSAYSPQVYGWITQRFPEGVPEDQLDSIAAQFRTAPTQADPSVQPTGLRLAAGGG